MQELGVPQNSKLVDRLGPECGTVVYDHSRVDENAIIWNGSGHQKHSPYHVEPSWKTHCHRTQCNSQPHSHNPLVGHFSASYNIVEFFTSCRHRTGENLGCAVQCE